MYRTILTTHRADLGRVIRAIADSDGAVVVHCTAGKDRTGLVAALTLRALGVGEETIVADYAATEENLAGEWAERMLRKVRRFRVPLTPELTQVLTGSPAEALRDTLEWLDAEHDGSRAYLAAAGVDDAVIAKLRRALLE